VRPELKLVTHLRESGRRISVWIVVIACHLGLLMLFLQPASDESDTKPLAKDKEHALLLRFLSLPPPYAPPVTPTTRQVFRSPRPRAVVPTRHTAVSSVQSPVEVAAPSSVEAHTMPTEPMPTEAPNEADANSDGGFGQRLREAQHGSAIHGVPGSDKAFVPGIHFVNPMDQGIGAVVRQAQRLFGVTSRQCIDVEAWRKLTTQELVTRHISPDDVDREDEKYQCNAPPGLHF